MPPCRIPESHYLRAEPAEPLVKNTRPNPSRQRSWNSSHFKFPSPDKAVGMTRLFKEGLFWSSPFNGRARTPA